METAPQTVLLPISFQLFNLHSFDQPLYVFNMCFVVSETQIRHVDSASVVVFVGLLFVVILSFFVVVRISRGDETRQVDFNPSSDDPTWSSWDYEYPKAIKVTIARHASFNKFFHRIFLPLGKSVDFFSRYRMIVWAISFSIHCLVWRSNSISARSQDFSIVWKSRFWCIYIGLVTLVSLSTGCLIYVACVLCKEKPVPIFFGYARFDPNY
jgi:hypothetical protein